MIVLSTPTQARLIDYPVRKEQLVKALAYTDKAIDFELGRTKKTVRRWESSGARAALIESMGEETYLTRISELRDKVKTLTVARKKTILFEDADGLYTHSGVAYRLARAAAERVERRYELPEAKPLPWDHVPRFEDRPYQVEALAGLLRYAGEGPCGVELATGSGKSTIIRNILKSLGLGAVIMAPSTSIAGQLYDDLVYHFGKRYVGLYGDGKKQHDKLLVVGIDDSLRLVDRDSEAWANLSAKPVFIADESHLTPAETLQRVCFGLMAQAPYRFFFSATQLRNDGLDIVLDGITGRIVLKKDVRELVDEGWLAKPTFKMVRVRSNSSYTTDDAVRMTRKHLYYNRVVNEQVADLANKFVSLMKRPTLILVKEVEQFSKILPHLKHAAKFAHGPLSAANKELVPEAYRADKPKALVEAFNRGEIPILVGTSCIATGTDIQVAEAGIYLMGGRSEIEVRQGVGRYTRGGFNGKVMNPWTGKQKLNAVIVDFDVVLREDEGQEGVLHRHAEDRAAIYNDTYGPVEQINRLSYM